MPMKTFKSLFNTTPNMKFFVWGKMWVSFDLSHKYPLSYEDAKNKMKEMTEKFPKIIFELRDEKGTVYKQYRP